MIKKMLIGSLSMIVIMPMLCMVMIMGAIGESGSGSSDRPSIDGHPGSIHPSGDESVFGFILPTPDYVVNSPFGKRPGILNGFHNGIDLDCDTGDPILSIADGIVTYNHPDNYGAEVIIIRYPDNGNAYVMYAHMSVVYVDVGQEVQQGEEIAACGSTGYSTGPHLHLEMKVNGQYRDPANYLPRNGYQEDEGSSAQNGEEIW